MSVAVRRRSAPHAQHHPQGEENAQCDLGINNQGIGDGLVSLCINGNKISGGKIQPCRKKEGQRDQRGRNLANTKITIGLQHGLIVCRQSCQTGHRIGVGNGEQRINTVRKTSYCQQARDNQHRQQWSIHSLQVEKRILFHDSGPW